MDLAFYTYFYGSNNNPAFYIPEIPTLKYKCYYFTNNMNMFNLLKNSNWIPIFDNKPINENLIASCMDGKDIKVLPHKNDVLQSHSYLCYLDNKLIHIDIDFVERYINNYFIQQNYALLLRVHQFVHESVWNEFKESMLQERYRIQSDQYRQYIKSQLDNGLSETTPTHCTCNFIIRNMKHEKINSINETWYQHIQECGIQDQISFFFVKQIYESYIFPYTESQYKQHQNRQQYNMMSLINNVTRIVM
uniref:DUF616 domain-containing protein n=1 Tax=viral metagenome TaxID=1070528 RepID=A0A6C0JQ12_9ZZZZ